MEIIPILTALRRNGLGALLIGLQIALTLAIVCNSLSIIQQRLERTHRPSGLDEGDIFTMRNQWVGQPEDLPVRIREDLTALRSLPGVVDVVATESYPLNGRGPSAGVAFTADQKQPAASATYYMVDEHGLPAFGVRLAAGRGFTADEIRQFRATDTYIPSVAIITRALAATLFPSGDALGKNIYFLSSKAPTQIVGIVDRCQTPLAATSWGEQFVENSAFLPAQLVQTKLSYIMRTHSGQRDSVMRVAPSKLLQLSRARIIDNIAPFSETRARAYHGDLALSLILGFVSALLLIVTAFGVIGLTSYWVAQRRNQIGIRRALGARRIDILGYFHLENLLIAGCGGAAGIALGISVNLWLATSLQLTRMNIEFIGLGAVIVFALSQAAVLWPALRASHTPPAIAARGA
jgi:putative ABC transport system permease protein